MFLRLYGTLIGSKEIYVVSSLSRFMKFVRVIPVNERLQICTRDKVGMIVNNECGCVIIRLRAVFHCRK